MAVARFQNFFGARPGVNPNKLSPQNAVVARNTRLWRGTVDRLKGPSAVAGVNTTPDPSTIFRYTPSIWLEWTADVDAVRSPVPNDPYDRVFFTGVSYPRVADNARITSGTPPYPGASLRLGVPAPVNPPGVTVSGTATDPNDLPETRAYVITYVNSFGEEGPPSPVSSPVDVRPGQSVSVSLPGPPSGNYEITQVRIYRALAAGGQGAFLLVSTVSVSTMSYLDSVDTSQLVVELPSLEWDEPPSDMKGLVSLPGGFLAGFRKNELLFSEVGLPHAWPVRYRIPVDYDIVALGVINNTLVVMTNGLLYLATGVHPSSMVLAKSEIYQACVSKAAVVDMGSSVVYPSSDGLVQVSAGGAVVVSRAAFDHDAWQALAPSTMKATLWRGLYLCFYNNGVPGGFLFNPAQPDAGIVDIDVTMMPSALFADLEESRTYLVYGGNINEWDTGSPMPNAWRSRPVDLPAPAPMRCAQVLADSYPVTLKVWRDGVLQDQVSIRDDTAVRLASSRRGRVYQVEVSDCDGVRDVAVASSMNELLTV